VAGKLRVTQVKSTISHIARNRATIKALGLHGIGSSVEVADNDATRGMVRQVRFLVKVDELSGDGTAQASKAGAPAKSDAPKAEKADSA
jgi:large subunit ribosomal protein L30